MKKKIAVLFALAPLVSSVALARATLEVESGFALQAKNAVRIPSTGGTDIAISQASLLPFLRLQATLELAPRHELRALWAPYNVRNTVTSTGPVDFNGETFAANVPIETQYQFNSYRLTYRYRLTGDDEPLLFAIGGTLKIRDAYIRFTQGAVTTTSANVGPVPLLHLLLRYRFNDRWDFWADVDGLAAPQGRAVDLYVGVRYRPSADWYLGLGYRTLEGGASNDTIHNFTWIHYAAVTAGYVL